MKLSTIIFFSGIFFSAFLLPIYSYSQNNIYDTINFGKQKIIFPSSYWTNIENNAEELENRFNNCINCQKQIDFIIMSLPLIEEILEKEKLPKEMKYMAFFYNPDLAGTRDSSIAGFWQARPNFYVDLGLRNPKILKSKIDERFNIIKTTKKVCSFIKKDNAFFNNIILSMASLEISLGKLKNDLSTIDSQYYNKYAHKTFFYLDNEKKDSYANFLYRYLSFSLFLEKIIANKPTHFRFVPKDFEINKSVSKFTRESIAEKDKKNFKLDNHWIKKNCKNLPDDELYQVVIREEYTKDNVTFLLNKLPKNTPQVKKNAEIKEETKEEGEVRNENADEQEKKKDDVSLIEQEIENKNNNSTEVKGEEHQEIEKEEIPSIFHTVQKGETLYAISRKYNEPVKELRYKNHLSNPNHIFCGQVLLIKEKPSLRGDKGVFYIVQKEKNIQNIAKMYDISLDKILELNRFTENTILKNGQIIKISNENKSNKIIKNYFSFKTIDLRNNKRKRHLCLQNNLKIITKASSKSKRAKIIKKL
ncbi:MAG: LysM peptidoglycan-binding domain-containing protein [Cytophagales bacterium]|nr:MAG: LysM peptidoglycan-binding domain-containing protein [Cytophagales bacterium]